MGINRLHYVNKTPRWGSYPCFSSSSSHLNERHGGFYRPMQTLQSFINQLWVESEAGTWPRSAERTKSNKRSPQTRSRLDGHKENVFTTNRTPLWPHSPVILPPRPPIPSVLRAPMFTLDTRPRSSDASFGGTEVLERMSPGLWRRVSAGRVSATGQACQQGLIAAIGAAVRAPSRVNQSLVPSLLSSTLFFFTPFLFV